MQQENIKIQDILETTDRRRVKLSKIGAAILNHIQKYDDVIITPAHEALDKTIPQRSDI